MLRRPKHSKIEVVMPKGEEEEKEGKEEGREGEEEGGGGEGGGGGEEEGGGGGEEEEEENEKEDEEEEEEKEEEFELHSSEPNSFDAKHFKLKRFYCIRYTYKAVFCAFLTTHLTQNTQD